MAKHLANCVINHSFIEILSAENTSAIASYIIKTVKESSKFKLINIFNHANNVIRWLLFTDKSYSMSFKLQNS